MKWVILLIIFIPTAVALMPGFNNAISIARSSWPEGSFALNLIPSPIEFAIVVLVVAAISLAVYISTRVTQ